MNDVLRTWESSAMRELMRLASRVASGEANVLILGENGTGKSLLAREIHASSPRSDGPLIRVDMGSLPETRFVDEMFGDDERRPRPGRFELAQGGQPGAGRGLQHPNGPAGQIAACARRR
jgi:DNA-binding NtrC family response regulator